MNCGYNHYFNFCHFDGIRWHLMLGFIFTITRKFEHIFFKIFFKMFIYSWERQRASRGGAEREGDIGSKAGSRFWTVSHRAQRGSQSYKSWDCDLSWSQTLNQLSHPGALTFYLFMLMFKNAIRSTWVAQLVKHLTDFGWGHNLMVCEMEPHVAIFSLKINKLKKKKSSSIFKTKRM